MITVNGQLINLSKYIISERIAKSNYSLNVYLGNSLYSNTIGSHKHLLDYYLIEMQSSIYHIQFEIP